MPARLDVARSVQGGSPLEAWQALFEATWSIWQPYLSPTDFVAEVDRRDRKTAAYDLLLSSAAWDLWSEYYGAAARTADALKAWWAQTQGGRAILLLDGLSLREAPWLLRGASERGYEVRQARATGAELPTETDPFAQALGFAQRSVLQSNSAPKTHAFTGAFTESFNLPWKECLDHIPPEKDVLLWHWWPDSRLHDLAKPNGPAELTKEAAQQLQSDDFWALVERLATGRRLVITADHGYAASGNFPDTSDERQSAYLKEKYKSRRFATGASASGEWIPPIDYQLSSPHGSAAYVLGRRRWKSPGGYPTLTHGGLSLMEVAVPFIELSRPGGQ